jgi:hypothetical protein
MHLACVPTWHLFYASIDNAISVHWVITLNIHNLITKFREEIPIANARAVQMTT